MILKDDWPAARSRFEAFWQRELLDRCCCAVISPRSGVAIPEPPPAPRDDDELVARWLDPVYNLQRIVSRLRATWFGGEAYPATTMCLGASVMAAFYGARVEYRPETVWYHPVIDDLGSANWRVRLEESPLYQETMAATEHYVAECGERYLVGLPELGSATDDLSLLRGMQELVLDMVDYPEATHEAIHALVDTWSVVHSRLFRMAQTCNDGGCCIPWMQTWAPGPHFQMSCDFAAVLSPELFREFIVPELEGYMAVNEFSVYHLDGPDALKHVETLTELPRLRAIQWTSGDGQPDGGDECWYPYYRRIQEAGKCLVLVGVDPARVEALLSGVSSRGLMFTTHVPSEEAGQSLLKGIAKWTRE